MTQKPFSPSKGVESAARSAETDPRRFIKGVATVAGTVPLVGSGVARGAAQGASGPGCTEWKQPTDADFEATIGRDKAAFIDRALSLIENEMVPTTM